MSTTKYTNKKQKQCCSTKATLRNDEGFERREAHQNCSLPLGWYTSNKGRIFRVVTALWGFLTQLKLRLLHTGFELSITSSITVRGVVRKVSTSVRNSTSTERKRRTPLVHVSHLMCMWVPEVSRCAYLCFTRVFLNGICPFKNATTPA